ncbi:MAG: hypothetical protein HC853_18795, partial [Anaerolineae bacterium]|nr:hypothetical protein [Anaerolineae bacterium]
NSTFAYKSKPHDVRQVGRDLGVRYVVEGSVQAHDEQLRLTAQLIDAQTGAHVEVLEMDDLEKRVQAASEAEVRAKEQEIAATFEIAMPGRDKISMPVSEDAMEWAARVACGLDGLVRDFDLNGLTYYYRGLDGNSSEVLGASLIVGNSLLTARGVPCAGEGDLKTNLSMLIMDRFGAGGSYTEFYAMDFAEQFILMGHDGPMHVAIAEGKPLLRGLGLFHGKRGYGLSVEAKVKYGPITILGTTQTADGRLKFLVAEGESIPGKTMQIGNTNSRLRFAQAPPSLWMRGVCTGRRITWRWGWGMCAAKSRSWRG